MAKSGFNLIGGVRKVTPAQAPGGSISVNAATAPGRGLESVGGSIRQVAEQVGGEFIRRSAQARTTGILVEADTAMINAETEFETWKQTNPDETTWAKKWKESTDTLNKTFADKKMTIQGRAALNTKLTAWSERSTVRVRAQEATATNTRARSQIETGATEAYKRGAFEVGDDYIASAVDSGLMTLEEAAIFTAQGRNIADVALIEQTILDDPNKAVETLKDKNFVKSLFPEQRRVLLNRAKVADKNRQTGILNGFQERILAGEIIPKSEFEEAVKSKGITATQSKYLQDQQAGSDDYGDSLIKSLRIQEKIDAYKFGGGGNELLEAEIANDIEVMPKAFRSNLANQFLSRKNNTNKVHPSAIEAIKIKRKLGLFGETRNYTKALAGGEDALVGTPIDVEAAEQAYRIEYETRDDLEKFVSRNPDASLSDQLEFIDDITSVAVEPIEAEEVLEDGNFFFDYLFTPTALPRTIDKYRALFENGEEE